MLKKKEKKKTKLQLAQEQAEAAIKKTNLKIDELGNNTNSLYQKINIVQSLFDVIRNVPNERRLQYEKIRKIRLNWKSQADKIESDFNTAKIKNAGGVAVGIGAGAAVAAFAPTAAMGLATTFGVASTGTAISTLSGAAATNAALAWIGGGALAAGGGGMAAGQTFLALAGPVGWAIAGVSLLGSSLLFIKRKSDKGRLEKIYTLISERDVKSYNLAIVELNERISRIKIETKLLDDAIRKINTFGTDYDTMTENQQYTLGSYVNLMESSTQLLINPIIGLQPKYADKDYEQFLFDLSCIPGIYRQFKDLIIGLSNLLYSIPLDEKDSKLLIKSLKKNKKFLSVMKVGKKDFDNSILTAVEKCLKYKYIHG